MAHSRQSGFSLVEVAIAAAIFMALVVVISTLAVTGTDAQELGRRISKMTEIAQDVTDDLRLEMVSASRLYGNDVEGQELLSLLDLTEAPASIASTRLPTVDLDGPFRQDTSGDEITGNAALFSYLAWRDRYRCASGTDYIVDVYRLSHYYLSDQGQGPVAGSRGGLDLVHFVSEPLADGAAIDNIASTVDRDEVARHLLTGTPDIDGRSRDPIQVVWLRSAPPNAVGTLRQIDDDGSLSDTVLPGTDRPVGWSILPRENPVRGILEYRRASVATNFDLEAPGISRFALRDDASGYPHGLEVQIIGPSVARQLLWHLVLIDPLRKGPPAWSQVQTIIASRDR